MGYEHTHRCTHIQRHTAVDNTKVFLHAFSIALQHMSKYCTNLLEIIDFYRFGCSSILHEQTEIEKAAVVRKGNVCVLLL